MLTEAPVMSDIASMKAKIGRIVQLVEGKRHHAPLGE